MMSTPRDPWSSLADATPARIALGRTGVSLPTREVLAFALAHAMARDAVHAELDAEALCAQLAGLGLEVIRVESAAIDRALYLQRPDLGRRLSDGARKSLEALAHTSKPEIIIVIGDGLSAKAVQAHTFALLDAFLPMVGDLRFGPLVIVRGARVAIADEIGACLGARLVVMLIGERPGLSSPDSLGVYLTYDPHPGCTDGERNCISNIRPEGLPPAIAAGRLAWLVRAALSRRVSGIALKDESGEVIAGSGSQECTTQSGLPPEK